MPAIKRMRLNGFLSNAPRITRKVRKTPRSSRVFSAFLGLVLLFAASGCAPSPQSQSASQSNDLPELTDDVIRERINETAVWDVPEENRATEPISWNFDEDEPKEVTVVEKQIEGERATIVLDIKTRSGARSRNPLSLAGQIRTKWEIKTGWAMRRWEIVETENISMKYKNLPKPPAQNSNR